MNMQRPVIVTRLYAPAASSSIVKTTYCLSTYLNMYAIFRISSHVQKNINCISLIFKVLPSPRRQLSAAASILRVTYMDIFSAAVTSYVWYCNLKPCITIFMQYPCGIRSSFTDLASIPVGRRDP